MKVWQYSFMVGVLRATFLARAGISALAHLGQPRLRHRTRLINGQFPVLTKVGLAPLASHARGSQVKSAI